MTEQPFNYDPGHYEEALRSTLKPAPGLSEEEYEDEITRLARESLKRMSEMKGKSK